MEQKSKIEMHSAGRNNPCGTEKSDRDASDRDKVIPVEQKVIAGSGETIAENTKAAWNAKVVLRKAQTENSATK